MFYAKMHFLQSSSWEISVANPMYKSYHYNHCCINLIDPVDFFSPRRNTLLVFCRLPDLESRKWPSGAFSSQHPKYRIGMLNSGSEPFEPISFCPIWDNTWHCINHSVNNITNKNKIKTKLCCCLHKINVIL